MFGQSAEQLLRETAKNYQTLTNYELSGHAAMEKPGSAWKALWEFTLLGPHEELPADGGAPKMASGAGRTGRFQFVKIAADSSEPRPAHASFNFGLLVGFGKKIADDVVRVERTGKESLTFDGEGVACEVLKVTYTPATYERPHPESVTYWISTAKQLILKEQFTYKDARSEERDLWTVTFDSLKLNHPIPQWARDMGKTPAFTERAEWVGKTAPEFTLPAADGSKVTLASLRGKPVLLDFWSILCGPCKLEMPMVEELGREYQDKGVVLLGISFDPAAKSQAWLDQNKHALRTLTDSEFAVSDAYKVEGIPALVLIGRDGKVKQYWVGMVKKETVRADLEDSLRR